jgi:hypothetical protein
LRFQAVAWRLYADFAMPCRLEEYRRLLLSARESGYEIVSVAKAWSLVGESARTPGRKLFVLRHDVDTGIRTARRMWEIDRSVGALGSYFFRLSTRDVELMREVHHGGAEASYHYEEIATEAKRLGLRSAEEVHRIMPEIRKLFRRNLESLRRDSGAPMTIVASHGDWVNRRLGIANWELLKDRDFRRQVGIELEVYDEEFRGQLRNRHSDRSYPRFWERDSPFHALEAGVPIVSVLVHPRHWRVDRRDNLREDVGRLVEELRFGR